MPITIAGFSSAEKLPGFYGEVKFGAGGTAFGSIPKRILVIGTMDELNGTATPDSSVDLIDSVDTANTLYGDGFQITRLIRAISRIKGIKVWGAPVSEGGGAAAAAATVTISGTWTDAGEIDVWIDGIGPINVPIAKDDDDDAVANSIEAKVNALAYLPATANATANACLLTRKSKGASGNDGTVRVSTKKAPAGLVATIAGGTALTGNAKRFASGTGSEDYSVPLALVQGQRFDRIVIAANDSSAASDLEDHLIDQADVNEGIRQQGIVGANGDLSAATTLSQSTLNTPRIQLGWANDHDSTPGEIAAVLGAMRLREEQSNANANLDDLVLLGLPPHFEAADVPNRTTMSSALDVGVTPLTTKNGDMVIVRSITSKSLNGTDPDYSTLDTQNVTVPDDVLDELDVFWSSAYKPANPYVDDDPETGDAPAQTATPSRWNNEVKRILIRRALANHVTDVEENPPNSEYNTDAKRIMSQVPVIAKPHHHQIGVSVLQL